MHKLYSKKKDITDWLDKFLPEVDYELVAIKEYGFVVNTFQDVYLSAKDLTGIPVKFNIVDGHFTICNAFTSLYGSPHEVRGDFDCSYNKLTTLQYAPVSVEGDFNCSDNELVDLTGAPERVGAFLCSYNYLKSLKGAPKIIEGYFTCANNMLTDDALYEYCPEVILGDINFLLNRFDKFSEVRNFTTLQAIMEREKMNNTLLVANKSLTVHKV